MIASLYQSSSASFGSASICAITFMSGGSSRDAAQENGGIVGRIDAQAHTAPFDGLPLASDQVLDKAYRTPGIWRPDLHVAEMEPELPRPAAGKRDGDGHCVVVRDRFLEKADHLAVVDLREAQVAGLQQCRIGAAQLIEPADIGLDVAGLVPVAHLDLVFLRVEIFLPAGNGLMLDELEAVVDAVVRRQCGGE